MAEKRPITPTKPHFFQPLLPGFQHHLSIPVSFYLKHLKQKNAEKAVLRSPSGKLWHVKINGRSIEDGWQEFCEDHQFHVGDFLVFRQDDDFLFDVLVFDSSTCQKDYPLFIKDKIAETPQEDRPQESAGQPKTKKKGMTKLEGKGGFSGSQYPHFTMNLSSYAASSATLYIPKGFARANGLNDRRRKVVLLSEQGKVWVAHLGFKERDGQPYINNRWSAFRCTNSLKAGDLCLFELIRDGEKPVLKITKLGCPQDTNPSPEPEKHPTSNTARTGAGSSLRNLRVHVSVKETYVKYDVMRIPTRFAKKSGLIRERLEAMTLQNEKGRSWTVSLQKSTTGGVRIGSGWTTFARSNGIKAGDVLLLELIRKGEKPVMRISVVEGVKRGGESERKISGTRGDVKPVAEIKEEVDAM